MATPGAPRPGTLPHFEVTTLDGERVRYRAIWQRRNLVLILADPAQPSAAAPYAEALGARQREFDDTETAVVITGDTLAGLPQPGIVIADRWGEIVHVGAQYPEIGEVLSWVRFLAIQCPECPP